MTQRLPAILVALATLSIGVAGCLADGDPLSPTAAPAPEGTSRVVDPDGESVPYARASATGPAGSVLSIVSANATGILSHARIDPAAERLTVRGDNATWTGPARDPPAVIRLQASTAPGPEPGVLSFLDPIRLGTAHLGGTSQTCRVPDNTCGASEPVLEVASDGTVYVSGVCCVGESPPIWVSRENGAAGTFEPLEGDLLRESFGIEGDFSIDDAGNLYFTDISVASAYIASWDAEGTHRHTLPAGPFAPIVDRPWTRAGAENVVHFVYNTGANTMYYKSTDGGLTWTPKMQFQGALGTPGQGPERDHLWVTAGGTLYESTGAGETWRGAGEIPRPSGEGTTFQPYDVPVVDEDGNVWIVYDWRNGTSQDAPFHVYAVRRSAQGAWHAPVQVSPAEGTHHLPWAATGRGGTLVLAWYGTLDDEADPNSVDEDANWHLWTAASVDADTPEPSFQLQTPDDRRVHQGPMNRKLLDFLQVEIGPQGRVHVAYAQDRDGQVSEATEYVRSTTGLDLAPDVYPNGP